MPTPLFPLSRGHHEPEAVGPLGLLAGLVQGTVPQRTGGSRVQLRSSTYVHSNRKGKGSS